MALQVAELQAKVTAETGDFDKGMAHVNTSIYNTGQEFRRETANELGIDAIRKVGALFTDTIGDAISLDQHMRNINSLGAGLSDSDLLHYSEALIERQAAIGQSTESLGNALYDIVSSGFDATIDGATGSSDALYLLDAANMAAAAGMTTVDVSAKAMAATINAYGLEVTDAERVSDIWFQTVNSGVLSFEELANNIGDILPLAANLGTTQEEIGAAYASMTLQGMNAAQAETMLVGVHKAMIGPTDQANEAMLAYTDGMYDSVPAFIAAQEEGDKLGAYLQFLNDVTGGNQEALRELLPDQRAYIGALALMNQGVSGYTTQYETMVNALEEGGITQAAFEEQMLGAGMAVKVAEGSIQAFGTALAMEMVPFIIAGSQAISGLVQAFLGLPDSVTKGVAAFAAMFAAIAAITIAATVLGPLLAGLVSPIGLIATGLAAILALGVIAYNENWFGFADAVNAVKDAVVGAWNGFKGLIADGINPVTAALWSIGTAIENVFGENPISDWMEEAGWGFSGMTSRIKGLIESGFNPLSATLYGVAQTLRGVFGDDNPVSRWMQQAATGIQKFTDSLSQMLNAGINPVSSALWALGAGFGAVFGGDNIVTDWANRAAAGIHTFVTELDMLLMSGLNPVSSTLWALASGIEMAFGENGFSNFLRDSAVGVRVFGEQLDGLLKSGINPLSAGMWALASGIEAAFGENFVTDWLRDAGKAVYDFGQNLRKAIPAAKKTSKAWKGMGVSDLTADLYGLSAFFEEMEWEGASDFFEKLGDVALDAEFRMQSLLNSGMNPLAAGIANLGWIIQDLTGLPIGETIESWASAIDSMMDASSAAAEAGINPLAAAIVGIGAAIADLTGNVDIAQWFNNAALGVDTFFGSLGSLLGQGINPVTAGLTSLADAIIAMGGSADLAQWFRDAATAAQTFGDTLAAGIAEGLNPFHAAVEGIVASMSEWLDVDLSGITDFLDSFAEGMANILEGDWSALGDQLGDFFSGLGEQIGTIDLGQVAVTVGEWITDRAMDVWQWLQDRATEVKEAINLGDVLVTVGQWLGDGIKNVWEWLKEKSAEWGGKVLELGDVLVNVANWLGDGIQNVWDWLKEKSAEWGGKILELGDVLVDVANWLGDGIDNVWDWLETTAIPAMGASLVKLGEVALELSYKLAGGLTNLWSWLSTELVAKIGEAAVPLGDIAIEFGYKLKEGFETVGTWIRGQYESLKGTVEALNVEEIKVNVNSWAEGIIAPIEDFFKSLLGTGGITGSGPRFAGMGIGSRGIDVGTVTIDVTEWAAPEGGFDFSSLVENISAGIADIGDTIKLTAEAAGAVVNGVATAIGDAFDGATAGMTEGEIIAGIANFGSKIGAFVGSTLSNVLNNETFQNIVSVAVAGIGTLLIGIIAGALTEEEVDFSGLGEAIDTLIQDGLEYALMGGFSDKEIDAGISSGSGPSPAAGAIKTWFNEMGEKMFAAIGEEFSKLGSDVQAIGQAIGSGVTDFVGGLFDYLGSEFAMAGEASDQLYADIADWAGNLAEGMVTTISEALNRAFVDGTDDAHIDAGMASGSGAGNVPSGVQSLLDDIVRGIGIAFEEMGSALSSLPNPFEALGAIIAGWFEDLGSAITKAALTVEKAIREAIANVAGALGDAQPFGIEGFPGTDAAAQVAEDQRARIGEIDKELGINIHLVPEDIDSSGLDGVGEDLILPPQEAELGIVAKPKVENINSEGITPQVRDYLRDVEPIEAEIPVDPKPVIGTGGGMIQGGPGGGGGGGGGWWMPMAPILANDLADAPPLPGVGEAYGGLVGRTIREADIRDSIGGAEGGAGLATGLDTTLAGEMTTAELTQLSAALGTKMGEAVSTAFTNFNTGNYGGSGAMQEGGIGQSLVTALTAQVTGADWSSISTALETAATEAATGFQTGLTTGLQETMSAATAVIDTLGLIFATLAEQAVTAGTTAGTGFQTGLNTGMQEAMAAATAVVDALNAIFASLAATATEAGTSAGTGFQTGLNTGMQAAMAAATAVVDALGAIFTSLAETATTAGANAGEGFNTGLSSGMDAAVGAAQAAADAIVAALQTAAAGAEAAGIAIGQGLVTGMNSMVGQVEAAAGRLAAAASAAIPAEIRSSSPSKVTHQYGEWFGEGFINGILEMVQGAVSSARNLAQSSHSALGEESSGAEKESRSLGQQLAEGYWRGMLDQIPETEGAARFMIRRAIAEADSSADKWFAKSKGSSMMAEFYENQLSDIDPKLQPGLWDDINKKMNQERVKAGTSGSTAANFEQFQVKQDLKKARRSGASKKEIKALQLEARLLGQLSKAYYQSAVAPDGSAQAEIAAMQIEYLETKLGELEDLDVGAGIGKDMNAGMGTATSAVRKGTDAMKGDLESVGGVAEQAAEKMGTSFQSGAQDAQSAMQGVVDQLGTTAEEASVEGQQTGENYGTGVASGVSTSMPDVQAMIDEIFAKVGLERASNQGTQLGTAFGNGVEHGIDTGVNEHQMMNELGTGMTEATQSLKPQVQELGSSVGTAWASGMDKSMFAAERTAEQQISSMRKFYDQIASMSSKAGTATGKGFADGIASSNAPERATQVLNKTGNALVSGGGDVTQKATDAGLEIGRGIADGISRSGEDAVRTATTTNSRINNTLGNSFSKLDLGQLNTSSITHSVNTTLRDLGKVSGSTQGSQVGSTFSDGMVVGINNKKGMIGTAVEDAIDLAYQKGMDRAKAKSPSERFAVLGGFLSSGMALGILSEADSVSRAMGHVVDGAAKELAGFNGNVAVSTEFEGKMGRRAGDNRPAPTTISNQYIFPDARFDRVDDFVEYFYTQSEQTAISAARGVD